MMGRIEVSLFLFPSEENRPQDHKNSPSDVASWAMYFGACPSHGCAMVSNGIGSSLQSVFKSLACFCSWSDGGNFTACDGDDSRSQKKLDRRACGQLHGFSERRSHPLLPRSVVLRSDHSPIHAQSWVFCFCHSGQIYDWTRNPMLLFSLTGVANSTITSWKDKPGTVSAFQWKAPSLDVGAIKFVYVLSVVVFFCLFLQTTQRTDWA